MTGLGLKPLNGHFLLAIATIFGTSLKLHMSRFSHFWPFDGTALCRIIGVSRAERKGVRD